MLIMIDGRNIEAGKGETILDVCRRESIPVPTLCYHEALGGKGICRLCLVEVTEPGSSRSRLVASCTYPATEGLKVETGSDKVRRVRRTVISLLARRAPDDPVLIKLAEEYDAPHLTPLSVEPDRCIMCRLCIHACAQMGAFAIDAMFRGTDKRVATPYDEAAETCTGCGACARICPTGAIKMVEQDGKRIIWNKEFTLVSCARCGTPFATEEEIRRAQGQGVDGVQLCERCRKVYLADNIKRFARGD